nr:hypothetical protein 24 [bacterium]
MASPSKKKEPDQYSYIKPDKIEYFSDEQASDTESLNIRFSVVPASSLRILSSEENARYMTADQMRRLTDNLSRDNALTSVVCVYPEKQKLTVLSGNHRVEAAIAAGHKQVPVLVIQTPLSKERRISIQLSHNAITGQDDPNLLKKHYESLTMEYKAYSGLTDDNFPILNKLNIDGLSIGSPKYEEISLMFLPSEKEAFTNQLEKFEKAKDKKISHILASYDDFDSFFDAIVAVKEFKNVFNNAVAIRLMADLAMEKIIEYGEQEEIQDKAN